MPVRSDSRRSIAEAVLGVGALYDPLETGSAASTLSNDTRPNDDILHTHYILIGSVCINLTVKHVSKTNVHGKAVIITYSDCVSIGLVIQHAKYLHHSVICGLSNCTIFLGVFS